MKKAILSVVAGTLTLAASCAIAQEDLPPGPHRDLVVRACSTCHDLINLTATGGLSAEDWSGTLDDMKNYGAQLTDEERKQILEYLVSALPRK
jgi:hypothetical protein